MRAKWQFSLFNSLPFWWTDEDTNLIKEYLRQDMRDDCPEPPLDGDLEGEEYQRNIDAWCESIHPRASEYRCRNCDFWDSLNGLDGECSGPEIHCGNTEADTGCEQWQPRII